MEEIWKDIKNYEGFYQASNLGRIKSLTHSVASNLKNVKSITKKGKILNQYLRNKTKAKNTYLSVTLCNGKTRKVFFVHVLIANTFLGKKPQSTEINHKDGNKENNCIYNLEYISHRENMHHALVNGLKPKTPFGKLNHLTKPIKQYDLEGKYLKTYYGQKEINDTFGKYANSNIRQCALKKRKTSYGYIWEY